MEIGIQFYTLRDYCKNLDDFADSFKKDADIGYKNVQISAVCDYEPEWLKEQLDKNGLKCVLTHTAAAQLTDNTVQVCRNHDVFDCKNIGLGYYDFSLVKDGVKYEDFKKTYTPVAKTIKENGKYFMYQNHAKEFLKLDNGKVILEQMAEDFAPDELGFILDTFWIQAAGGDPAAWVEKLKGRIPVIHLKDYAYNENFKEFCDNIAVIGEGILNFDRVFEKAESSGVEYMVVEQDNCHDENPFDCIKRSYDYLKSCGF